MAVFATGFAVFVAVLSRLVADDYKAWSPKILDWLVRRAVVALPSELQERYDEEWRSHLTDTPGELSKLIIALGFKAAANRISRGSSTLDVMLDRLIAACLLVIVAPLMVLTSILIRTVDLGPALARYPRVGVGSRRYTLYKFRTRYSGQSGNGDALAMMLGGFLRFTRIDELPCLFNVVCGNLTFPQTMEEIYPSKPNTRSEIIRGIRICVVSICLSIILVPFICFYYQHRHEYSIVFVCIGATSFLLITISLLLLTTGLAKRTAITSAIFGIFSIGSLLLL
jgi:Bacterial sugar transferase